MTEDDVRDEGWGWFSLRPFDFATHVTSPFHISTYVTNRKSASHRCYIFPMYFSDIHASRNDIVKN